MDRQIILAVGFAIFCMLIFGGMFLGSGATGGGGDPARTAYSPDDIRYRFQQAEAKQAKKKHKTRAQSPAPDQNVSDGFTSSGGGDSNSSDDSNEEPSLSDHEPQEEPPLE